MVRILRTLSPLLALIVLACAAPRSNAPASSASSTSGAQAASGAAPRLICRTERPTGSNIPHRICYTEEQLDEMSRAAQDAHRRATQSSTQPQRD